MQAGEAPHTIRAALELNKTTYTRWARQYGFRQSDRRAALAERAIGSDKSLGKTEAGSAKAVLAAVRAAIADGDRAGADKLVATWSAQRRRDRALSTLEAEAQQAAVEREHAAELSDEALVAEVSRLIGRPVRLNDSR